MGDGEAGDSSGEEGGEGGEVGRSGRGDRSCLILGRGGGLELELEPEPCALLMHVIIHPRGRTDEDGYARLRRNGRLEHDAVWDSVRF